MRKTCTPAFRDFVADLYPGLGEDLAYWRFMRRLLFSTKRDRTNGRVIIDWQMIAKDEGKDSLGSNYRSLPFLQRFKREVMPDFHWEEHIFEDRKARTANVTWPDDLVAALEDENTLIADAAERVYFVTGKSYTRKLAGAERASDKQEAIDRLEDTEHEDEPALPLLQYLNALPSNRFTSILESLPAAAADVARIQTETTRRNQYDVLASIRDQPQPYYQFSAKGKTVRIYPANTSILQLKRSVRHALCRGWYEFDLRSSQLAICAKLWKVKTVERFLDDGGNIWQSLADHYDVQLDDEFKAGVKEGLYSLMFGASRERLVWDLNASVKVYEPDEDCAWRRVPIGGREFFTHPLIATIYTARNRRIKDLVKGESITTAFGQTLSAGGDLKTARSILAQEAQAMELWLLMPVLDLAQNTDEFSIVLWQHDGFSVAFADRRRVASWVERIKETVKQRAAQVGVKTELDFAEL